MVKKPKSRKKFKKKMWVVICQLIDGYYLAYDSMREAKIAACGEDLILPVLVQEL